MPWESPYPRHPFLLLTWPWHWPDDLHIQSRYFKDVHAYVSDDVHMIHTPTFGYASFFFKFQSWSAYRLIGQLKWVEVQCLSSDLEDLSEESLLSVFCYCHGVRMNLHLFISPGTCQRRAWLIKDEIASQRRQTELLSVHWASRVDQRNDSETIHS